MKQSKQDFWQENIHINRVQYAYLMLQAKNKYAIMSRGTGKSFIVGAEVDENVRIMPRGVTTIAQATIGQALTKTLPSTFKMLEMLGYKPYDYDTHTGDYVVCKRPPDSFITPYEHIMQFDHVISFSNGHCLYILTQEGSSRGPNADFNITDEALTVDKEKFDREVAPTNRGNECIFGKRSQQPVIKHHGNAFLSSMPYTAQQKWLLAPADYYEKERGIPLFQKWNRMVQVQMQMIEAYIAHDKLLFCDLWNETVRMRREITPFVSKDSTLFLLGSVFDNIENLGMSYIVNQYRVMDKLSFMVEILNFVLDRVDHCYYKLDDRHLYYNATNDSFLRNFAEDHSYNWHDLAAIKDSRADLDCDPTQPLEISTDWGSAASFLSVGQERSYDFAAKLVSPMPVDCTINEFFVRRDDETDTEVNALADKFIAYYEHHACKRLTLYRDRYGDARRANSKKSYNDLFVERLQKYGWTVEQRVHPGMEPPQHEKFLLWTYILSETDPRFPHVRFNATRCRYTLISMQNTRVVEDSQGRFAKDKSSERKQSILPEEATHFGDCVDKRIWTKYYTRLQGLNTAFVDASF